MAGRKELRSIRFKAETTNGVQVAPRFVWRGNGEMIEDAREVTLVEEQVGIFNGTDREYIGKLFAKMELAETPVTFEQIPDLLQMCGFGTAGGGNRAGSAQGVSGSTAVFILPIPSTVAPLTYSYTTEAGDNVEAMVMPYTLCEELTIKGVGGEALMVEASLIGRYGTRTNASGSFSAAGTLPAVEDVLASRGSVWLAPAGSGWGTGALTPGNILGFEVTFKPAWEPKFSVDSGQLYFATAVYTGCEIEGEFTLEHQVSGTYGAAGSAGQMEKWRAELPQLLTMTWRGGVIPAGTTYLNKEFTMQLPIKYTAFEPMDDQNGNDIITAKWVSKYNLDTPAAGRGTIIVARQGTSEMAGA